MAHLHDMIDDLKKSGEWKMYLTIKSKFMPSTDSDEKRTMYSKSDSSIVMIGIDTDEIINNFFYSLLHKYQISPLLSMRCSNFIFDQVSRMHYIYSIR